MRMYTMDICKDENENVHGWKHVRMRMYENENV